MGAEEITSWATATRPCEGVESFLKIASKYAFRPLFACAATSCPFHSNADIKKWENASLFTLSDSLDREFVGNDNIVTQINGIRWQIDGWLWAVGLGLARAVNNLVRIFVKAG